VPALYLQKNVKGKMVSKLLFAGNYNISNSEILTLPQFMENLEIQGIIETAEKAIDAYQGINPDIIFIDAHLEGMSGFEVARFIKEQNSKIKIIILSEEFNLNFLRLTIDLKLEGYAPKNFGKDSFKSMVHDVLNKGSALHGPSSIRHQL
jgi:DNA-binding NarL/FixJ family response regulator